MYLSPDTFEYLKPTDEQLGQMEEMRKSFAKLAEKVLVYVPSGADQVHVIRLLRDAVMWANVGITRHADGTPRK